MLRLIIFALIFLWSATVSAQDTVGPIGSVEAGDFRALAVTADGNRLLIADAENDQLRVYDFNEPSTPTLINSVDLEGEPVAIAAAADFALVAVRTPEADDAVRVIAPSRYARPQGWRETNSFPVQDGVTRLVIAPDNDWALATSPGSYTLMELLSAGEINWLPRESEVVDAAVGDNIAYVLSRSMLVTETLGANVAMERSGELELDGTARRINLNVRLTVGVIVLNDSDLLLFDPATLEPISTLTVGGAAISDVQFVSSEQGEWLALTRTGSGDITLLDVSDPANISEREPLVTGFETPVQAMTTYNELIIATDGQTVRIFQT